MLSWGKFILFSNKIFEIMDDFEANDTLLELIHYFGQIIYFFSPFCWFLFFPSWLLNSLWALHCVAFHVCSLILTLVCLVSSVFNNRPKISFAKCLFYLHFLMWKRKSVRICLWINTVKFFLSFFSHMQLLILLVPFRLMSMNRS